MKKSFINKNHIKSFLQSISLGALTPQEILVLIFANRDAQTIVIPTQFGGPHCWLLCNNESIYAVKFQGRLVGQTVDSEGKRGCINVTST
ncbi:hypothetical protein CW304_06670 [Bacillus sp. UFRGS-B20]|nr:hypothetical protein CW304_06670 [Bacillus sp. UFRGS-B20]